MNEIRMVNSIGEVVPTDVPIPFIPYDLKSRSKELDAFIERFSTNLGLELHTKVKDSVTYNCVLNSNMAVVSLFVKVPIAEDSPFVQAAKEKNVQYPGLTKKDQESLTSVMLWEKDGQSAWYFLCIIRITFECNVCDGKWISAVLHAPRALHSFFPMTADIKNACAMASVAIDNNNHALSAIPKVVRTAFNTTLTQLGAADRAIYSNCASYCLAALNNVSYKKNINDLYLEIKRAIRHAFETAYSILLKGKMVLFTVDELPIPTQVVYIGGGVLDGETMSLIINGNIFHSVPDLQYGLPNAIEPCEWFDSIVKPNINK